MPFCNKHWCSNSHLVSTSSYWSYSILEEWDDNASCWPTSSFPCSKFLTLTFNCFNCSCNSTVSHLTFLAHDHDSILCNRPYNFTTCSLANLPLAFSYATCVCVWCFTSNPKPHLSMTFVMKSWRLLGSTILTLSKSEVSGWEWHIL